MKYLFFILVPVFLISCASDPKDDSGQHITQNNQTNLEDSVNIESDSVEADTLEHSGLINYELLLKSPLHYFPEEIAALKIYFSDSAIVALDSIQFSLYEANTDSAMLKAYQNLLNIESKMRDELWKLNLPGEKNDTYYPDYVINNLKPVDDASMGLRSTCVAECTEFDFVFFLDDFSKKSASTKGTLDDEFIALLQIADGDYGGDGTGWFQWFERTWDYGGGSLLGSGVHLEFLEKAVSFQEKYSLFDSLIESYRKSLLQDILHGIYMNEKEAVINEVSAIVAMPSLTEEEKKPLTSFLEKLNNDDFSCSNCPVDTLQFGCNSFNCNWGG